MSILLIIRIFTKIANIAMNLFFILTVEHSWWWLIACILISAGFTLLLYRKDKKTQEASVGQKTIMYTARFLSIFILSFFLLKPLIQNFTKKIVYPHVLFLYDNSSSIVASKDSNYYQVLYKKTFAQIEKDLINHNIPTYHYYFSDKIQNTDKQLFTGKYTNIAKAIKDANNLHINRNIGAIVLISDGIYNRGENPYYLSKEINAPIYTVGLGDTNTFRDIKIENIAINKIGKTKSKIPFSIDISGTQVKNETSKLQIFSDGKEMFSKKIILDKEKYFKTIKGFISPIDSGLHKITFRLQTLKNEKNTQNNQDAVYINIINTQENILLLSDAPHPDIAAIRKTLHSFPNYKITVQSVAKFKGDIKNYRLLILDQLPSKKHPITQILKNCIRSKKPILSIVSPITAISYLNKIPSGVSFTQRINSNEQYQAHFNPHFKSFNFSDDDIKWIENAPPLIGPLLKISSTTNMEILAYQKIKNINTENPLIFFTENEHNQYAYILGEGIWQWRIFDYQENEDFLSFSNLIEKIIQYLSLRSTHNLLNCNVKTNYQENENIKITAQLYNKSYETINDAELNFELIDSLQKKYNYIFSPNENDYELDLGTLAPGKYHFNISSTREQTKYNKSGDFVVNAVNVEMKDLKANHLLLKKIAQETHASFFYPQQYSSLRDSILNNPQIKSNTYSQEKLSDLISLKWLLFVIISLLALEWFLRKYVGSI